MRVIVPQPGSGYILSLQAASIRKISYGEEAGQECLVFLARDREPLFASCSRLLRRLGNGFSVGLQKQFHIRKQLLCCVDPQGMEPDLIPCR